MTETSKPKTEVQIELLKDIEIAEVAELARRTFVDAYGAYHDEEELAKTLEKERSVSYFENSKSSSTVLVAKQLGVIVGYAQYGEVKLPNIHADKDDRELGRLYVDTALHNRGVGRQLLDAVMAEPEMMTAPHVYLRVWENNPAAIGLYESYGFTIAGEINFTIKDGQATRDWIMLLDRSASTQTN